MNKQFLVVKTMLQAFTLREMRRNRVGLVQRTLFPTLRQRKNRQTPPKSSFKTMDQTSAEEKYVASAKSSFFDTPSVVRQNYKDACRGSSFQTYTPTRPLFEHRISVVGKKGRDRKGGVTLTAHRSSRQRKSRQTPGLSSFKTGVTTSARGSAGQGFFRYF